MAVIKFLSNGAPIKADVQLEGHRVVVTVANPVADVNSLIASGFHELNENNNNVMSDFSDHKYLYHQEDDGCTFTLTNEPDDIWFEEVFIPEPTIEVATEATTEPIADAVEEIAEESVEETKTRSRRKKN